MKKNFKKKNLIKMEGLVLERLPNNIFRVKLKNNKIVLAYLSGNMIKNHIKVIIEDIVLMEFSSVDLNKGRIIYRK